MKTYTRGAFVIGCLLFVLFLFPILAATWTELHALAHFGQPGWSSRAEQSRLRIYWVEAAALQTSLQPGDEIVALNGQSVTAARRLDVLQELPPNTTYRLTIRRAGQTADLELRTQPVLPRYWLRALLEPLVKLLFIVTGFVIFLLKPDNKQARVLALMLGAFAAVEPEPLGHIPQWFMNLALIGRFLGFFFIAHTLHLFLVFPEPASLLRRFPWLETALYLPYALAVGSWYFCVTLPPVFPFLTGLARVAFAQPWFVPLAYGTAIAYMGLTLIALALNYLTATPLARRKLRLISAGGGLGLFAFFLQPTLTFLNVRYQYPQAYFWLEQFALPLHTLIPLSFAYAIARYRVIPVSLILRLGLRYLLVSRAATLLLIALAWLLASRALTALFATLHADTLTASWISAAVALAAWLLLSSFNRRYLVPVIDRHFFRQSYDAQQIIAELTEALRTVTNVPQLLELTATRLQSALQTESVTVFLRDRATGDCHSQFFARHDPATMGLVRTARQWRLPAYAAVVQQAADNGTAIEPELPEMTTAASSPATETGEVQLGNNQSQNVTALTAAEIAVLREINAALLLPLKARDELLGFIALGPRLGDLPFSAEDKRLLHSVAAPTSFALENARLVERMIEDARRREELEAENEARQRELEEARQLQLSMLPKTVPTLPHLEIAAYMKTATEVGGDYYDFHLDSHGTLTVAIGDATGHGLKAGTVVTAMKSLFGAYAHEPEMPKVFTQSSRVLKEMNLRSLFMALTMAKITGYTLRLVAAGMPPIFIYRALTGSVEDLVTKGLPLGTRSNYTYLEHELTLDPGDVVLLMSDGFPERFNPDGEELGYEPARQILASAAPHSATKIVELLVEAGDTWAQDRLQDDDITFVVLKVKA